MLDSKLQLAMPVCICWVKSWYKAERRYSDLQIPSTEYSDEFCLSVFVSHSHTETLGLYTGNDDDSVR